ncbi:unnamed protein product [Sphagnum tenellum]
MAMGSGAVGTYLFRVRFQLVYFPAIDHRSYKYFSAITVSRELSALYAEGCSADDSADDGVWKCWKVKVVQMTESGVGAE